MQSCDSKSSEPLSPHSVCRHLLLLHRGIPAPAPLSVLPFHTLNGCSPRFSQFSGEDSSVQAGLPSFMLVKEVEELACLKLSWEA